MKREIIAIVALFVILFAIPMASASFAQNFDIKVTMVNQEPDPVNPDSYVDVRFKIENLGTGEAQDVKFEIVSFLNRTRKLCSQRSWNAAIKADG
jgi:hypothetical protein